MEGKGRFGASLFARTSDCGHRRPVRRRAAAPRVARSGAGTRKTRTMTRGGLGGGASAGGARGGWAGAARIGPSHIGGGPIVGRGRGGWRAGERGESARNHRRGKQKAKSRRETNASSLFGWLRARARSQRVALRRIQTHQEGPHVVLVDVKGQAAQPDARELGLERGAQWRGKRGRDCGRGGEGGRRGRLRGRVERPVVRRRHSARRRWTDWIVSLWLFFCFFLLLLFVLARTRLASLYSFVVSLFVELSFF
jgi:hypothetical protein